MDDESSTTNKGAPPPSSRGKRLARALVVTGALAVALLGVRRPLLAGLASLMRVDNPAPSGAIVVWTEDESEPLEKAAALFKRGLAPVILLTRGLPNPIEPVESSERSRRDLVQRLGVPEGAVVVVPGLAGNLHEAARRVNEYSTGIR